MVTARELAEKLNITAKDLLGLLIQKGVMVTTNQALPHELAEEICADLEVDAMVASAEEVIEFEREESEELTVRWSRDRRWSPSWATWTTERPRFSTQSARAGSPSRRREGSPSTSVPRKIETDDGRTVVFVDTPGHEAFTQMRARGAQVTDIVVLVVAADDGVMPQTVEAINHARAGQRADHRRGQQDRQGQREPGPRQATARRAGDPGRGLGRRCPVGRGLGQDRRGHQRPARHDPPGRRDARTSRQPSKDPPAASCSRPARRKGRGIVATVIVQQGTLECRRLLLLRLHLGPGAGHRGRHRQTVDTAGPSDPVEIMGFDGVPGAGDVLQVTESEDKALEVASFRSQNGTRKRASLANRKVSLENLFDQIAESEIKELNVVDQGRRAGLGRGARETLGTLGTEKVKINVLHGSVGAVTTNDVMLASASNAIIIGFSVRPERTAQDLAEAEQVDIRLYTVIYDLIDDIKKAMVGLLEPVFREEELGRAEVREIFRVPKIGAIAGSHVIEGIISRNAKVRLLRDNVVIYEGQIASLRQFKDDASEVRQGFDCGIGLERYQDIKVGDVIEAYKMVENDARARRSLSRPLRHLGDIRMNDNLYIGVARLELHVPEARSLKEKRSHTEP